ncbi:MAG: hypothetical protein ABW032_10250 [Burkholderiaceae bacterium]
MTSPLSTPADLGPPDTVSIPEYRSPATERHSSQDRRLSAEARFPNLPQQVNVPIPHRYAPEELALVPAWSFRVDHATAEQHGWMGMQTVDVLVNRSRVVDYLLDFLEVNEESEIYVLGYNFTTMPTSFLTSQPELPLFTVDMESCIALALGGRSQQKVHIGLWHVQVYNSGAEDSIEKTIQSWKNDEGVSQIVGGMRGGEKGVKMSEDLALLLFDVCARNGVTFIFNETCGNRKYLEKNVEGVLVQVPDRSPIGIMATRELNVRFYRGVAAGRAGAMAKGQDAFPAPPGRAGSSRCNSHPRRRNSTLHRDDATSDALDVFRQMAIGPVQASTDPRASGSRMAVDEPSGIPIIATEKLSGWDRVEAADSAFEECRSFGEIRTAVANLPECGSEQEAVELGRAFMRAHIAAAKEKGQLLIVLMGEKHDRQSCVMPNLGMMAEAYLEYGSDVIYAVEAPPGGAFLGSLAGFDASMPEATGTARAKQFEKEVGAGLTHPTDKAVRRSMTDAVLKYVAYRMSFFIEGYDPINASLGLGYTMTGQGRLHRGGGIHTKLRGKIDSGGCSAILVQMGDWHLPGENEALQEYAHVACFAPIRELVPEHDDPALDWAVPLASYLLHHSEITRFKAAPGLDNTPMAYLDFVKERIGIDLSQQAPGGRDGFGSGHAEHALKIANRLREEGAGADEFWRRLGEQGPILRQRVDFLLAPPVTELSSEAVAARTVQALRLGAAILPMYGSNDAPEPDKDDGERFAQRLLAIARQGRHHHEAGLVMHGAAMAQEGKGVPEAAGSLLAGAVDSFQRADQTPEQHARLRAALAACVAITERLDASAVSTSTGGDSGAKARTIRRTVAAAGLIGAIVELLDAEKNGRVDLVGARKRLQAAADAAVESGDPKIGCAVLEAASLLAAAESDTAEARRLLTLAERRRDIHDFPRLTRNTDEGRRLQKKFEGISGHGETPELDPGDVGESDPRRWAAAAAPLNAFPAR